MANNDIRYDGRVAIVTGAGGGNDYYQLFFSNIYILELKKGFF